MYPGLGKDPSMLINAAFALTTIGQFALVLLIATFLFSYAVRKRSPVLLNLLVICLLGTVPQFFLMYAAELYNPKPPPGLCVTQAAILDSVQCTFAVVSLSLVIDLLVESQLILPETTKTRYLRMMLVIIPHITFLVFVSTAAAVSAAHPDHVRHMPNDLACTLRNATFTTSVQIFIAAVVVLTLSLETYAIVRSLATRRHLPTLRRPRLLSFSQVARIVAFTCLQALLLVLNILHTYARDDAVRIATILLEALMPLATFGIFGLTTDCCQHWKGLVRQVFKRQPRDTPKLRPLHLMVKITIEEEKHEHDVFAPGSVKPVHLQLDSRILPC